MMIAVIHLHTNQNSRIYFLNLNCQVIFLFIVVLKDTDSKYFKMFGFMYLEIQNTKGAHSKYYKNFNLGLCILSILSISIFVLNDLEFMNSNSNLILILISIS